nr:extracellular solute-binding protein [uncultured Rhodoferax sp.]
MQEITVAVPRYPLFEIFQGVEALSEEFERECGIKVHLMRIDASDAPLLIASAIKQHPSPIDVWLQPFNHSSYALFTEGLLECLDPYIADTLQREPSYDFDDIDPALMQSARFSGKSYGIPLLFESYILIYNKKLLARYLGGRLPQTMQELIDVAQYVTDTSRGDVYGAVLRGVESAGPIDTVAGVVYNAMGAKGGAQPGNVWFDGAWSRPSLDNPATMQGLVQYAELLQCGPPDALRINWDRAAELFQQGKALFFIDATQFTVYFEAADSEVAGQTGYALLPPVECGGPSWTGHWELGWLLARNSAHKNAAWRYIEHMSGKDADERISKYTAGAMRRSTWQNSNYTRALNPELHKVAQASLRNSHTTLVAHPAWEAMATTIMRAVRQISVGGDPRKAIQVAMGMLATIAAQDQDERHV